MVEKAENPNLLGGAMRKRRIRQPEV